MPRYKATAYLWLSYTADCSEESDSITNQKKLIEDFVAAHLDIELTAEKWTTDTAVYCLTVQLFRK